MWWGQRVRASREEPKQRALQKKRRGWAESREVMMGMCEAAGNREQQTFILTVEIREDFPAEVACEPGFGQLIRFQYTEEWEIPKRFGAEGRV